MTGLKRGIVRLENHDDNWDTDALYVIAQLKTILGEAARDIRHVGSTSIKRIVAKPIIDIAVGVDNFDNITPYEDQLRAGKFIKCRWDREGDHLYVCGDAENTMRTHHIHFVIYGSREWRDYNNFRDYLNTYPDVADEYMNLKLRLAEQYPEDRFAYTDGKAEFIKSTLRRALVWSFLGTIVTVKIDRPLGSTHPKHPDILYAVNYGYVPGVIADDGEELDAYVFGEDKPLEHFTGRVIAVIYRDDDNEDKLVVAPDGIHFTSDEIKAATEFQERFFKSHIEVMADE